MDSNHMSTHGYDTGSRSGRIRLEKQQNYSGPMSKEELEGFSGKLSLESPRPIFWKRDNKNWRASCEVD